MFTTSVCVCMYVIVCVYVFLCVYVGELVCVKKFSNKVKIIISSDDFGNLVCNTKSSGNSSVGTAPSVFNRKTINLTENKSFL